MLLQDSLIELIKRIDQFGSKQNLFTLSIVNLLNWLFKCNELYVPSSKLYEGSVNHLSLVPMNVCKSTRYVCPLSPNYT